MFNTEDDLVTVLCAYLIQDGHEVFREVALYGRRIDVLAVRKTTMYAFEAKLSRWSQALMQAQRHLVAVNYSTVVMPLSIAQRIRPEPFQRVGIGLVGISWERSVSMTDPSLSRELWEPAQTQLMQTIECFRETGTTLCIM